MADEFKVLMRFEVDSKQAVSDTKQVADSLDNVNRQQQEAARTGGEARKEQVKNYEETTKKVNEYNQSIDQSTESGGKFRDVLGKINPELGDMAELATDGKDTIKSLFKSIDLGTVAAVAGIAAVVAALRDMMELWKQANEYAENFRRQMEAIIRMQQANQKARVQGLAAAGVGTQEAADRARALEYRLVNEGFDEEAIRQIAPMIINAKGELEATMDEIKALAAQAEFGQLPTIDEPTAKGRYRARSQAARIRARYPAASQSWVKTIEQRRQNLLTRVNQMDRVAIGERLTQMEGIEGDDLDKAVEDLMDVVQEGMIEKEDLDTGTYQGRLFWGMRQREAARRAKALRLLNDREFHAFSNVSGYEAELGWKGMRWLREQWSGDNRRQQLLEKYGPTPIYNYGTIYNGGQKPGPVSRSSGF